MKKIIFFLSIVMFLASCAEKTKITGHISNADNAMLYFECNKMSNIEVLDSVKLNKKGKFSKYSIEDKYLISAIRTRITEAKSNNKRYPNRPFNIDADYMYNIWKLQNGKCYLTGVPLSLDKQQPNSLSIDKIYPELGYTKGNVRWASWAANRAKGDLTFEVFHSMCQRILEKCNDYRKEDGTYQIPIFLS